LGYVKKAKYITLQKQLEKTQADLKSAQQQASGCHCLHKFEIYNEGVRTWQLDLVTGEKCIVRTNEADLKKPETKMQVCEDDHPTTSARLGASSPLYSRTAYNLE